MPAGCSRCVKSDFDTVWGYRDASFGYCSGSSGIIRSFIGVYRATGDPEHLEWALRFGRGILRSGVPGRQTPSNAWVFHQCCGSAAVLESFIGLWLETGDDLWLEAARAQGDDLLIRSIFDGRGRRWYSESHVLPTGTGKAEVGHQVGAVFGEVTEQFGRIDILVNNAGIAAGAPLDQLPLELWHQVLAADLHSVLYCCQQVAPGVKARRYGKIVNTASTAFRGDAAMSPYSTAKAGVLGLTRSLAKELAPFDITVNAVCPSMTRTSILDGIAPEVIAAIAASFPQKRAAEAYEIASVIAFLASDDSSFVNGESILITGARIT